MKVDVGPAAGKQGVATLQNLCNCLLLAKVFSIWCFMTLGNDFYYFISRDTSPQYLVRLQFIEKGSIPSIETEGIKALW